MKINKKFLFSGLGLVMGLALISYLGSSFIPKTLVTLSKASMKQTISVKESLVLGQKIMAEADGQEKCVVNVFVLDKDGKGIKGKIVQLSGLGELELVTDASGKASFELVSSVAGSYELVASINGTALTKTVKVIFR